MGEISGQEHEPDQPGKFRWPLNGRADSVMRGFLESENELVWTGGLGDYGPDRSHCRFRERYFPFIGKNLSEMRH